MDCRIDIFFDWLNHILGSGNDLSEMICQSLPNFLDRPLVTLIPIGLSLQRFDEWGNFVRQCGKDYNIK